MREVRVYFFVRMEGLEPPCREALDPKSSASTNFATSAHVSKLRRKCTNNKYMFNSEQIFFSKDG